jgi:hypothetical protein
VLEVVERDEHVGQHQRHVRQPEHVGLGSGRRSTARTQSKPKKPTAASRERRQAGDRRLAVLGDGLAGERVGVSPVFEAPAQHAARAPADERPATTFWPCSGGLEQERGAVAAQLQEGGDRRLAVLDEAVADRDQVVGSRQRARLLERRA